ncbi:protein of unknown function [Nitrospira japonica]|uniref:Uncharacterized protein n=1 Tax=Nitrospira japonica TaxID=1325564 RepID=A0A1W1I3X4_9BACT|nr:protein of unknown function [Nitrospira japonica]
MSVKVSVSISSPRSLLTQWTLTLPAIDMRR